MKTSSRRSVGITLEHDERFHAEVPTGAILVDYISPTGGYSHHEFLIRGTAINKDGERGQIHRDGYMSVEQLPYRILVLVTKALLEVVE